MLSAIRNFSKSIFAKIFLIIIAIPFIFWGMGPVFNSGSKNVIVEIGNDKVNIQEFGNFINTHTPLNAQLNKKLIDQLFSSFIAEKVIDKEIEYFNIKVSDQVLKKIIINTDQFKKENKFSRTEYEKYLIKNNTNAILYEANISKQYKRKLLFDMISGGVNPSLSMVNLKYNEINQKRSIELIDLNNFLKNKTKISNEEIKKYHESNKEKYKVVKKIIKFNKINPKNLIGSDEFDSLFFEKVDEIEDLISEGRSVVDISKQFNLNLPKEKKFSRSKFDEKKDYGDDFPKELVDIIFRIVKSEPTILREKGNEYFIIELISTEEVIKSSDDAEVKKDILTILRKQNKIKVLSEVATKVNNKTFLKTDFDNFSKNENSEIKKLTIENLNDDKDLDKNLISQIYNLPKSGMMVITDPNLVKNYLVFVQNIENSYIKENNKSYDKYFNLSKIKLTSSLYNTYDLYLKEKYKIDINYKALKSINNYTE
jgi:peptidyl-prolyl cis-trans isomerase D|tara:strand:+ start:211 stop:1659 length:1449 start_codon:yes stop_codon:yes gene_type:complete